MRRTAIECIRFDWQITATCGACGHSAALDLVALSMKHGGDFDCTATNLEQRLKCTGCGRQGVRVSYLQLPPNNRLRWATPEEGGREYDWHAERMKQLDVAIERARRKD